VSFQVFHRGVEEDADFLGYEAALLTNRSFETSVTDYRMTERLIPEYHLCQLQTPRLGIAEDPKFCFVNLMIIYFQYNSLSTPKFDLNLLLPSSGTFSRKILSPIIRIDLNILTCL